MRVSTFGTLLSTSVSGPAQPPLHVILSITTSSSCGMHLQRTTRCNYVKVSTGLFCVPDCHCSLPPQSIFFGFRMRLRCFGTQKQCFFLFWKAPKWWLSYILQFNAVICCSCLTTLLDLRSRNAKSWGLSWLCTQADRTATFMFDSSKIPSYFLQTAIIENQVSADGTVILYYPCWDMGYCFRQSRWCGAPVSRCSIQKTLPGSNRVFSFAETYNRLVSPRVSCIFTFLWTTTPTCRLYYTPQPVHTFTFRVLFFMVDRWFHLITVLLHIHTIIPVAMVPHRGLIWGLTK